MFMNKRYLVFPLIILLLASCGQMAQYAARQEFQDGIYYKATDKVVKEADLLTEEEIAERAAENIRRALDDVQLPEVQDFLRDCLPAFSMTLDELNHPTV